MATLDPMLHCLLRALPLLRAHRLPRAPRLSTLPAWLLACLLVATLPARAHDTLPPGIAWIDGDVERALATAQAQQRPLFLYWGAVWCPPCNQVKAVLFRNSAFQQRLQGFVPVYLDGDGDAAQRWGGKFGVVGYPTLLVLSPAGKEIARLLGETDVQRMLRILDLARETGRPVSELAQRAAGGGQLSDDEWQLLAAHGWELDADAGSPAQRDLLATLARTAPAAVPGLAGRLWLHALADTPPEKLPWAHEGAPQALLALLGNDHLAYENRDLLENPPQAGLDSLAPLEPALERRLRAAWSNALRRLEGLSTLSCTERLALTGARLDLQASGSGPAHAPLDPDDLALVRARVAACDRDTQDPLERQSVMSAASDLLQQAGLDTEAAALIEAEIPRAHVPAYFMQERAALARRQGLGEDAAEWSGLAYAASSGAATRLQWGVRHLQDLTEFEPDHHAAIAAMAAVMLREAGTLPDAFADRNLRSLDRLHHLLDSWMAHQPLSAAERRQLAQGWSQLCHASRPQPAAPASLCGAAS